MIFVFTTAGLQINNKTDTPVINFPAVNVEAKKSEFFYNVIKCQNTMNTREYVLYSPAFAVILAS